MSTTTPTPINLPQEPCKHGFSDKNICSDCLMEAGHDHITRVVKALTPKKVKRAVKNPAVLN